MSTGLPKRVAVVTGGSAGIGQACAQRLAQDGIDVVIADLRPAEQTLRLIAEAGVRARAVACDVTQAEQVEQLAAEVEADFGRCDILVNNAGRYSMLPFEQITLETWRSYMALNLDAVFLLCKAFLPGMKRRGWGRIINMASNSALLGAPRMAHYIASKGGVIGLTRALAAEFGESGITVNALAPGPTLTETVVESFYASVGSRDEAAFKSFLNLLSQNQAIKRTGTPGDVVGALAFVASDAAAFMTGQTLVVDGGWAHT
ncbi:MAG TPA: SDR family oxidoreductase [Steroidobacteraceae bacterium]|nr:SDR family oxidoreductase [Steroidobacteraceae bacterium]